MHANVSECVQRNDQLLFINQNVNNPTIINKHKSKDAISKVLMQASINKVFFSNSHFQIFKIFFLKFKDRLNRNVKLTLNLSKSRITHE